MENEKIIEMLKKCEYEYVNGEWYVIIGNKELNVKSEWEEIVKMLKNW